MDEILKSFGFLALICGLAVAADRSLSKEARLRIGAALRSRAESSLSPSRQFNNPAAFVEKINAFSLRGIGLSVALSLSSLLVILYIQYFLLNFDFAIIYEGVEKNYVRTFTSFFIFMLATNFITDYLSFVQTLTIIQMVSKSDRKWKVSILFVTDLLASLNIFTFLYAMFLTIGLFYFLSEHQQSKAVVSVETVDDTSRVGNYDKLQSDFSELTGKSIKDVTGFKLYSLESGTPLVIASGVISSSQKVSSADIIEGLRIFLPLSITSDITIEESKGRIEYKFFGVDRSVDYSLRLEIPFETIIGDYFDWYSAAYLQSDKVQDRFVEVTTLNPGFQTVQEVRIYAFSTERLHPDYTAILICDGVIIDEADGKNCDLPILFYSDDASSALEDMSGNYDVKGSLPLYTFLFSSLSLTIFVYMAYISAYLIAWWEYFSRAKYVPALSNLNLDEHPILVLCLPFAVIGSFAFYFSFPTS